MLILSKNDEQNKKINIIKRNISCSVVQKFQVTKYESTTSTTKFNVNITWYYVIKFLILYLLALFNKLLCSLLLHFPLEYDTEYIQGFIFANFSASVIEMQWTCEIYKSINYLILYQRFSVNNLAITAANVQT